MNTIIIHAASSLLNSALEAQSKTVDECVLEYLASSQISMFTERNLNLAFVAMPFKYVLFVTCCQVVVLIHIAKLKASLEISCNIH